MSDVKRWTMQGYDEQAVDHADGEWVMYGDHAASREADARALAEKDARIEALERALRDVTDHFAAVMRAPHVKYDADPEKMPSIAEARAALAPAQESAESAFDAMDRAQDEQEAAYQRQIDEERQAFRYARDEPAPCALCGGSGLVRRYDERNFMGMSDQDDPCPNGCAKPCEEG